MINTYIFQNLDINGLLILKLLILDFIMINDEVRVVKYSGFSHGSLIVCNAASVAHMELVFRIGLNFTLVLV